MATQYNDLMAVHSTITKLSV